MPYTYETNGAAIYKASFRTIRSESDLERFNQDEEKVAETITNYVFRH